MNENQNPFQENVEELIRKELDLPLTEEEKMIASLPSNSVAPEANITKPEKGDMTPVLVQSSYDPITGINTPMETSEIDKDLEDIEKIAQEFDFDPDTLVDHLLDAKNITSDKLFAFIEEKFDTLPKEDIQAMVDTAMDHVNKIPVNYYKKLPVSIQTQIDQSISGAGDPSMLKSLRNSTSRSFVENLVDEYVMQDGGIDINSCISEIQNAGKKLNDELKGMETGIRINMITKVIDNYDKKREEDPTLEPNSVVEALRQAVNLTEFKEFCKTVKIKKFDIEKLKPFESFNQKYYTHSLNIHDIRSCPTILARHIQHHVEDKGIYKVCLAFCKYCMNHSPDIPEQHMFMYYFVENIYLLDLICPNGVIIQDNNRSAEMMKFYHTYISALKECIENIK